METYPKSKSLYYEKLIQEICKIYHKKQYIFYELQSFLDTMGNTFLPNGLFETFINYNMEVIFFVCEKFET